MKILLISPCKTTKARRSKFIMIPQLALHLIGALTPPEHEVKVIEEEIEDIPFDDNCDLVGISCMTSNAPRGYRIAQEFRARGKKVVMGGVHPTLLPNEALRHADSVVIGEAEGVWRDVIKDAEKGRLQSTYHKPSPSLDEYLSIRTRGSAKKRFFDIMPVMTTRGCPYGCEFCCVHDIFGRKIRHVPVPNVVRDIAESKGKFFLFLDDNIIGDQKYAKELFQALIPLRIKWVGQASVSLVNNKDLIRLAVQSGCEALFFGIESVSETQASSLRKSLKSTKETEEAIRKIKDHGIYFHPSLIFGFDDDTRDTFPATLDFLMRNNVSSASLNVLTPYPGTRTYERMASEGRLLTDDWKYYNHTTVVFEPKTMSPFELQAGRLWVSTEFLKWGSLLKRLPHHLDHPFYHLFLNIGLRQSHKMEFDMLPNLASDLYGMDGEIFKRRSPLALRGFRFADVLPGRPAGAE
jgi:radical SAM superfamily enzyme YgiQ (UPF0313 family)